MYISVMKRKYESLGGKNFVYYKSLQNRKSNYFKYILLSWLSLLICDFICQAFGKKTNPDTQ